MFDCYFNFIFYYMLLNPRHASTASCLAVNVTPFPLQFVAVMMRELLLIFVIQTVVDVSACETLVDPDVIFVTKVTTDFHSA